MIPTNILSYTDLLSNGAANDAVKEKISHEILKAMTLESPSLLFKELREAGLLCKILPSLDRCYELDGGAYHKETVFEHCMLVGDTLPAAMPKLRLAGYLHDTGKYDAAIMKNGSLYFAGHENHVEAVHQDLIKLEFSTKLISYIIALIKAHMYPLKDDSSPKAVRRLRARLDELGVSSRDFMRMRIADRKGNLAKKPYTLSDIKLRFRKLYHCLNHTSSLQDLLQG